MAFWPGGASDWAKEARFIRRPIDQGAGDDAMLRELVRFGTLAANSHNTQPWLFSLSEKQIAIQPDLSRRCTAADPDDHHLFASLGCAVENIAQAAPVFGQTATPRDYSPDVSQIKVDLNPGSSKVGDLASAIPLRQCTRAVYNGEPVSNEDLKTLESSAQGNGVELLLITDRKQIEEVLAFIVDGNTHQVEDPAFRAELNDWLRFSYAKATSTRDGLFSAASGFPILPDPLMRRLFELGFSATSENKRYEKQVRSASGLAVFVSAKDCPAQWVEAGRSYQRFALQATVLGLRHAFVNQAVEVAEVRRRFTSFLNLGDRRPDLIVRFGYGPEMPRSLRRPVEEVIL